MSNKTLDVYLSCSKQDQIIVDSLGSKLRTSKIKYWYASRSLLLPSELIDAVNKAIDACKIVVVILTSQYNDDTFCHSDIWKAFERGKPIVVFATENVDFPETLTRVYKAASKQKRSTSVIPIDAWALPLEPHIDVLIRILRIHLERTDKQLQFKTSLDFDYYYEDASNKPPGGAEMISVLFLSADPTNASRLRLGEEFREIDEQLRLAKKRDGVKLLLPQLSLRPRDISGALLNEQPQIVHFSGHGTATGALCFESQTGQTQFVQPDALAALFEQFTNQVNCVVLNACHSEIQANAIAKHIDYVIGMNQAIGDKAAIAFAIGFYQALGADRAIEEAYKLGCVQIQLQGIPEHLTPVLLKRKSHPTEPQRVILEITPIERLENDCPHISVVVKNGGSRTIFCKVESHGIYDSSGKDIKRSVSTYANHFSWSGGSDKGIKEIPVNLDNVINLVKVNKQGYGIAFLFDENPHSHWKTEGTYKLDLKIVGKFGEDSLDMEPISQVVRVEFEYIKRETQSNTGEVINNSELKLLNWKLVEND